MQENPHNTGVDCAILMNTRTWKASGHLGGFSDEKEYGEEGGKRLGNDGGDRRARDAHMKAVDEKRVQRDIGDGADADGEHSRLAVSLTDDIGVQSRREDGENGARRVPGEIFRRVGSAVASRAEQA